MKLTELSCRFNMQQRIQAQDEPEKTNVKSNLEKNIGFVKSLSIESIQKNSAIDKSANIIKDCFRQIIADKSYNKMFSQGTYFKKLGTDLPERPAGKSSLYSLQHLNKISKSYLTKIKEKTGNLTPQEKNLLSKVVNTHLHFRHQSNANLSGETLNIMSNDKLRARDISAASNTYLQDIKYLSNHDFVFFGVEFSEDKSKLPLNTKHTNTDYGANAYIIEGQHPYGYLTLTDHLDNLIPPAFTHEHKKFVSKFSKVRNEIERHIHGENGIHDIPIYNTKDMKVALGLHLIDFLRNSVDKKFKKFTLSKSLDSKGLDNVLNLVFQPEFHVPRMVSTTNFKKVQLRDISLFDAIKASNAEEISKQIESKKDACDVMKMSIKYFKPDIAEYLFSTWKFTKEDMNEMSYGIDIEYELTDSCCINNKILEKVLQLGLIDPNKRFGKISTGNTMLDNAIKNCNKEMINLLLEHGAMTGYELEKINSERH